MTFMADSSAAEMFLLLNSCSHTVNSKGAFCFCQTPTEIHEMQTMIAHQLESEVLIVFPGGLLSSSALGGINQSLGVPQGDGEALRAEEHAGF